MSRVFRLMIAGLLAGMALPAAAADVEQFWPELNGFVTLDARQRLLFVTSLTHEQAVGPSEILLAVNYDRSLAPPGSGVLQRLLPDDPGTGSRYFWMRIGFRHLASVGVGGQDYNENSALAELSARYHLGADFTFVPRLRADIRNINGDWSARARLRGAVEWDTQLFGIAMAPYVNAEIFYDTRYDAISRELYQAGAEFRVSSRWQLEPYIALQKDLKGSAPGEFLALGLVLKTDF